MLATILKSPKAVETTLAIIEIFAKVKELGRVIHQVQTLPENSPTQRSLVEHTGDLIADLLIPEDGLEVTGTETTYEMNLALRDAMTFTSTRRNDFLNDILAPLQQALSVTPTYKIF